MIEKLDKDFGKLQKKINEIVDAVNELQESQNTYWTDIAEIKKELQTRAENVQPDAESRPENVLDKFAEQCKWLGKLCKFWDGDKQMSHLCWGILYMITPTSPVPFCCSLGDGITSDYEHCEPVLPDDNIIYKGE